MNRGQLDDVVVIGVAQTPVSEHWGISLRQLAARAILPVLKDAGGVKPQALYIANSLASSLSRQANMGALLTSDCGLEGIEGTTIEAGGASGGAALRTGYMAVRSGMIDTALVIGVEKMTDRVGSNVDKAIAEMMDTDYEGMLGMTPTTSAALLMQRYMHEYSMPHSAFSSYPMIASHNAAGNPSALYRKAIDQEIYDRSGILCDPLNLHDIASYADGAAALVLTRRELVPHDLAHAVVRISGSSVITDRLALHDRTLPLDFTAAGLSIERACRQAGILPGDVDILELDDSFSIYPVLSIEAAGFTPRGTGTAWLAERALQIGKGPRMACMGGMKGRGNPIAAAGVYQAVEAVLQLRGQAGACQVKGVSKALIQCLGGPASTAATHLLERIK